MGAKPRSKGLNIHRHMLPQSMLPHGIDDVTLAPIEKLYSPTEDTVKIKTYLRRHGVVQRGVIM